jgi:hypothetical protein
MAEKMLFDIGPDGRPYYDKNEHWVAGRDQYKNPPEAPWPTDIAGWGGGERMAWSPEQQYETIPGHFEGETWVPETYNKIGSYAGPAQFYKDEAKYGYGPQRQSLQWARNMQADARGAQLGALQQIQRRASGEDSVARMAGQRAQEDTMKSIASQYAAMGRGSPAARRAAMYAQSKLGQDLAAERTIAEAQERQKAQELALQGAGGIRGQDIGQFQQEQGWWKAQQDAQRDEQLVKEKFYRLGFEDKEAERRAILDYWNNLEKRVNERYAATPLEQSTLDKYLPLGVSAGSKALEMMSAIRGGGG